METAVERGQGGHHQQRCHHRHHDHHHNHRQQQGLALVGRVGVVVCWAYLYLIACAVPARCVSAAATFYFPFCFAHSSFFFFWGGVIRGGLGVVEGEMGEEDGMESLERNRKI